MFGPNLPNQGLSSLNQKKLIPLNSVYWNQFRHPGFSSEGQLLGRIQAKWRKNCMKITKSTPLCPNSEDTCRGQAIFFAQSEGSPCSLGKTLVTSFSLNDNLIFWTKFALKKKHFKSRTVKEEHHHLILHIQISLGTKFLPKLTILTFLTKFTQKRYVQSKGKKVNSNNEFFIFWTQGISE